MKNKGKGHNKEERNKLHPIFVLCMRQNGMVFNTD